MLSRIINEGVNEWRSNPPVTLNDSPAAMAEFCFDAEMLRTGIEMAEIGMLGVGWQ